MMNNNCTKSSFSIIAVKKEDRNPMLICWLLDVWRASVRASHHFLTEENIQRLSPYAELGLRNIHSLLVVESGQIPVGFMGVQDRKIEMLFLHPDCFRKGLGRRLVEYAFRELAVEYVDVNEQNPEAKIFYERMWFRVFKRNEHDAEGNPFPILEMKKVDV